MRIVVMSDSHGNYAAVESIIDRNTDADWIIHLGDGERELDRYIVSHPMIARKIIHVAGNCDFNSLSPNTFVLPVLNHKIFAAHGNKFGVDYSAEAIKRAAKEEECDIIIFGHTHCRLNRFEDDFYILNPGSASSPRDGNKPSFGHIDISPAGVVMNIHDI